MSLDEMRDANMNRAMTFIKTLYTNQWRFRNAGPLKIRLLQCYEALLIHNIDVICIQHKFLSPDFK